MECIGFKNFIHLTSLIFYPTYVLEINLETN
nr:MAG TPA: hypothetical protein [Caudoviricetes sp.]DAR02636.1 MAG TPA: hypothetical protein [Caudoviricetes sp.]DAX86830.1 MAG TPA: hypothetical protein [Caudoviricetes sp.]